MSLDGVEMVWCWTNVDDFGSYACYPKHLFNDDTHFNLFLKSIDLNKCKHCGQEIKVENCTNNWLMEGGQELIVRCSEWLTKPMASDRDKHSVYVKTMKFRTKYV